MFRNPWIKRFMVAGSFNPFVKVFIVSEGLLYSSVNLILPLFALFATNNISGGNIQIAASSISSHFLVRIITELMISQHVSKFPEKKKVAVVILGMMLISLSYIGFAMTTTVAPLYLFWAVSGIGWGIATPIKLSLFSTHLDKNEEAIEWGATDVFNLILVAVATTLGGIVASQFGFKILFILASLTNLLGIIPFLLYTQNLRTKLV